MIDNNEIIIKKSVTEDKLHERIIIHGAGKFNETKLFLTKLEAMLLYIDLHKILFKDEDNG